MKIPIPWASIYFYGDGWFWNIFYERIGKLVYGKAEGITLDETIKIVEGKIETYLKTGVMEK